MFVRNSDHVSLGSVIESPVKLISFVRNCLNQQKLDSASLLPNDRFQSALDLLPEELRHTGKTHLEYAVRLGKIQADEADIKQSGGTDKKIRNVGVEWQRLWDEYAKQANDIMDQGGEILSNTNGSIEGIINLAKFHDAAEEIRHEAETRSTARGLMPF